MGAYLSKPVKQKCHEEGENKFIRFASTSMQGWRVHQEDAHNCIVDFADGCSFFAVYDGHGGPEVSAYLAKNFPQFLKDNKLLENDENMQKNLQELFVKFDEHLRAEETVKLMEQLKAEAKSEAKEGDDWQEGEEDREEKERENLLEEACALSQEADLSIEQIIKQYTMCRNILIERIADQQVQSTEPTKRDRVKRPVMDPSPKIAKKRKTQEKDDEKAQKEETAEETIEEEKVKKDKECGEEQQNEELNENCAECNPNNVNGSAENEQKVRIDGEDQKNGENPLNPEGENGGETKKKEEKATELENKEKNNDTDSDRNFTADDLATRPSASTATMIENVSEEEDDDDSDYVVGKEEGEEEAETEEEEADDEEDEEDEEAEDESEEDIDQILMNAADSGGGGSNKAGFDSGSTACALLLFPQRIYCANIGDSRCVLCRAGKAVELSSDHKPEDAKERSRIEAAGGTVSEDGRVNGGLNLSRAFGDHYYKGNAQKELDHQMITALPDVTVTEPSDDDDFVVICCDGIWNSMSSQAVCEFVAERIAAKSLKEIGAELCDKCCAKDTTGDGTGCDNETVIIIDLKKDQRSSISSSSTAPPPNCSTSSPDSASASKNDSAT